MKNEKICVRKNLMYLFLISVFAVLFVVTVNYINSQQKETSSRATGLVASELLKECQKLKGKVARTVEGYYASGDRQGYDHFNGLYYSTTVPNPVVTPVVSNSYSEYCATEGKLTRVGEPVPPQSEFNYDQIKAACKEAKEGNVIAKTYEDYFGKDNPGYEYFTGEIYSITKKNPSVGWNNIHDYCATERKVTKGRSENKGAEGRFTYAVVLSACASAKGFRAKEYELGPVGGLSRKGYTRFNGGIYNFNRMNPKVEILNPNGKINTDTVFSYCADTGKIVGNWCSVYKNQENCGIADPTCAWDAGACVPVGPPIN